MSLWNRLAFIAAAIVASAPLMAAAASSARVHYMGGTGAGLTVKSDLKIDIGSDTDLMFETRGATLKVPYSNVNTLEYGEKVDRRIAEAFLLSPLFLLSKKHTRFLTIGFMDTDGHQQALVFKVEGKNMRGLLAGLEARTGRKVEFQDEEARRDGKG